MTGYQTVSARVGAGLLSLSLLAACVAPPSPAPATVPPPAPAAAATTVPPAGPVEASSGYRCPEPRVRLPVTSTTLNLYVWTEYIPLDALECFERVYGLTVNRVEYSSIDEMYAGLKTSRADYDLVQPTDYSVSRLIREGLLQKLDKSRLTVLDTFDPAYLNLPFDPGNDYTVPYQAGTYGIIVNTAQVKTPLTRWADLWRPEFAGRLVFLDDARAAIGLTLLTLGYDLNTRDPGQLTKAEAKLLELAPGIKLFDSDSPRTALLAGQVDLGMTWTGEAVLAQRVQPAIQYIYPADGVIFWQDNYALPAGAPHPDAAYAWLNYTLQPEVFWMMLRDFPYTMPSRGALEYARTDQPELYAAYTASAITQVPAEVFARAQRLDDVGEAAARYAAIWEKVMAGR